MISRQKWGRLIGHRNPGMREPPPPDELNVITSDHTRMFPPLGPIPTTGAATFSEVSAEVDPPVGGIAANGLILELPNAGGDVGVLTAIVARVGAPSAFFSPGIYRITGEVITSKRVTTVRQGFNFDLVPPVTNPAVGAFPWGQQVVRIGSIYVAVTASIEVQRARFDHRVYMPFPFEMLISNGVAALADADIFELRASIDNEVLLDEIGSALGT